MESSSYDDRNERTTVDSSAFYAAYGSNSNKPEKQTPPSTKFSSGDPRRIAISGRQHRTQSFDASSLVHSSHSHSLHSTAPLDALRPQAPSSTGKGNSPFSNYLRTKNENGADEEKQSLLTRPPIAISNTKQNKQENGKLKQSEKDSSKSGFLYYFIYALLNTTMSVPSLYGYASVIFNHDIFQPHIATLSKLVIWSSAVHQLVFVAFSSLSFAKAEVQDAGLLFLSCMSSFIAQTIINDGGGIEEVLSTTIVTLSVATASLGLVLMFLGKFNCANAVSYLPLPVVGGYLAFIGYFCVVAGIGLCISTSMVDGGFLSDVQLLMDKQSLMLAAPGLVAGLLMMVVARVAQSDAALPMTMVAIPASFYAVLYGFGYTLDDARQGNWVGEVRPTASVSSLVELIDFSQVRWDLVFSTRCISVWLGMVFVVSFSSCLDVAAISMDMGEPLDVNKELITVGFSNCKSRTILLL